MENNQQGSPCSCKSLTWKWSSCGMLNMIFKPLHNLQQAVFILVLVSVTSTHFQSTELDNYNCYPVWGACTLMHFAASACDAHTFKMLLSQVWTGYAGISINQQHLSDELYNYSVARWPLLKVSKWNKEHSSVQHAQRLLYWTHFLENKSRGSSVDDMQAEKYFSF